MKLNTTINVTLIVDKADHQISLVDAQDARVGAFLKASVSPLLYALAQEGDTCSNPALIAFFHKALRHAYNRYVTWYQGVIAGTMKGDAVALLRAQGLFDLVFELLLVPQITTISLDG